MRSPTSGIFGHVRTKRTAGWQFSPVLANFACKRPNLGIFVINPIPVVIPMSDIKETGRIQDDLAGLIRLRRKPKPEQPAKQSFPERALRYGVGKAPILSDPDKAD
jgi:hypothetical protein